MRVVLISDAFPPMRTSAAIQLRDLCNSFVEHGHIPTILIPDPKINNKWQIEDMDGLKIVRLKTFRMKDINYIQRTIAEFLMPFLMLRNLSKSPLAEEIWDGVIWYSPSIFLTPIAHVLRKRSGCKSYLIIRDIFPQWAIDMKLMRKGLPYLFFKAIANYQYSVADTIGVQTEGNIKYIPKNKLSENTDIEVLQNWLNKSPKASCSISLEKSNLANRKIFVYAGNMGVAQKTEVFLDLAEKLYNRNDIGFVFVGRGSNLDNLKKTTKKKNLDNVLFFDEINSEELPELFCQCDVGLVALDPKHRTHNIPGKFLSYVQNGLPVLATVNPNNDIIDIINQNKVGYVDSSDSIESLSKKALLLLENISEDKNIKSRCKRLYERLYSPRTAIKQIIHALS